jgi:hypothetical protein
MEALLGELTSFCGVWLSCIKLPELNNCGIIDVHYYISLATICLAGWIAFLPLLPNMVDFSGVGGKRTQVFYHGWAVKPSLYCPTAYSGSDASHDTLDDRNLLGCVTSRRLPNKMAGWFLYYCCGCRLGRRACMRVGGRVGAGVGVGVGWTNSLWGGWNIVVHW